MAFRGNIEKLTMNNNYYRKVLYTTPMMQLVVMSLKPREEIGFERHPITTQFIRVEEGCATAVIDGKRFYLKPDDSIIVPPGAYHNVTNTGDIKLKLYSIYSPPEHHPETKQKNKIEVF